MSCMHVWRCSPNLLHWKDGPMKFWFRVPTIWFLNSLTRSQKFVWDSKKSPALMIWPIDDHRMVCGIGFATFLKQLQETTIFFHKQKDMEQLSHSYRWVCSQRLMHSATWAACCSNDVCKTELWSTNTAADLSSIMSLNHMIRTRWFIISFLVLFHNGSLF